MTGKIVVICGGVTISKLLLLLLFFFFWQKNYCCYLWWGFYLKFGSFCLCAPKLDSCLAFLFLSCTTGTAYLHIPMSTFVEMGLPFMKGGLTLDGQTCVFVYKTQDLNGS